MPEERIDVLRYSPEIKNKSFWERVAPKAFPSELLDLIDYFNVPKDVLIKDESGNLAIVQGRKGMNREIMISSPQGRDENRKFKEFVEWLEELKYARLKIENNPLPSNYRVHEEMIRDHEIKLYGEIAAFFDQLRMRALEMALNEFNSSRTTERIMMMERVREANKE